MKPHPPSMLCAILGILAAAGAHSQTAPAPNSQPNPYRTIGNWAKLPAGRALGATSAIDVDRNGNVWVFDRCGAENCSGRSESPLMKFDRTGQLIQSFGAGMFVFPHGIGLDRDGNVWVTDALGRDGKGHQAFKFSPSGKLLMTLGKPGVAGADQDTFNQPADVAVSRDGSIFVADGHELQANGRIVKFSRDGTFIKAWGKNGTGPGQFRTPHALAFDSQGRLFVADRGNNRIQIFDQEGKFLEQWTQFGRPSALYIAANDTIYVGDSESNAERNPGWKRGLRIGSARSGAVMFFIPDPDAEPYRNNSGPEEGAAADGMGRIYSGGVTPKGLMQHVKR
jgi:DNA-binding beta-propeller fold protein YncE